MQSSYRYLFNALVLTAALAAPAMVSAAAAPRANAPQELQVRVYDHDHHDYHNWDSNEEGSYRLYLNEHHHEYRPYGEIKVKDQRSYWTWRHQHPDHNEHEGR